MSYPNDIYVMYIFNFDSINRYNFVKPYHFSIYLCHILEELDGIYI